MHKAIHDPRQDGHSDSASTPCGRARSTGHTVGELDSLFGQNSLHAS